MSNLLSYCMTEIPDQYFYSFQAEAAGQDVQSAVGRDTEYLLRSIASMAPGTASLVLRFEYDPRPENRHQQSRLRIYLIGNAHHPGMGESLRLLLEHGPMTRFYKLKRQGLQNFSSDLFTTACEIVRRKEAVEPLFPPEFNYRIPNYYFRIISFEPNTRNNYMDLDRVLSNVREKVTIHLCIGPVNMAPELKEHTRYLAQLQSINRGWAYEEDDDLAYEDYMGNDKGQHFNREKVLRPLRYGDPLADHLLRSQQRFHETLGQPHLGFQAAVFAQSPEISHLLASVVAESAFIDGSYRLSACSKGESRFDELLKGLKESRLIEPYCPGTIPAKSTADPYAGLVRLTNTATVDELKSLFRLPVASITSPRCIRRNTDPVHKTGEELLVLGVDQEGAGLPRGLLISSLTKHLFCTGFPGYGKTTAILNLLTQLHHHRIPFLVIEPVKTEYRILKTLKKCSNEDARHLASALQVYTPGEEDISPLRFNPLLRKTASISVDERIDGLLDCFMAAMPMSGPLPALLGEALERVYEMFPHEDDTPIIADLLRASEEVMAEKEYTSDPFSNLLEAQRVRLGNLHRRSIGKVFQCRHSYPDVESLMQAPAVIELDRLPRDQKALFTMFLLNNIREHLKTTPKTGSPPRYVIIIEEAHNIVGTNGHAQPSPDIADPKAFAAEFVCRMLVELRALEIGMVIVDQSPSSVAKEVIKSTASKLAFMLAHREDREEIAAAMNLEQHKIEEFGRLNIGDGFFITEEYYRPIKIKTTNLHDRLNLNTPVIYKDILPFVRDDAWYQKAAVERTATELLQLHELMNQFDENRLQLVQHLASLISLHPQIISGSDLGEVEKRLKGLRLEAQELRQKLHASYRKFIRDAYLRFLPPEDGPGLKDEVVRDMRGDLVSRFKSVIEPGVKDTLEMIDSFIGRCKQSMDRRQQHG